ncbi:MAG: sugar phosphate isomerase/epimerase [bacterium]
MLNVKVGYHCITWWQGKHGEKKEQNLIKSLDEISAVGYKGFETGLFLIDEYYGREKELKDIIAERNLELVTLYGGGGFIDPAKYDEEIERNTKGMEMLAKMGASIFVTAGGTKRPEGNTEADYQILAKALNELGRRCKDYGLKSCYHLHWKTMVETREQLTWLMENTDPNLVWLLADTAHLMRGGSEPVEVFKTYINRIAYTHFKDIDMNEVKEDAAKGDYRSVINYFKELGEGKVDFSSIIRIMDKSSYNGWIMIELDSTTRTPKESAQISKKYLEEKLGVKV